MTPKQQINCDFVQAALALHLISELQYEELLKEIRADINDCADFPFMMVKRGIITQKQVESINNIKEQSVSFSCSKHTRWTKLQADASVPLEANGSSLNTVMILSDSMSSEDDMKYGNYTIISPIGEGALGRVFQGMDCSLQREVAIKELLNNDRIANDKRLQVRFLNEARITGQLQHPGIVPVYQIGAKTDGGLFYVMKYVQGKTLEEALKELESEKSRVDYLRKRARLLDALISVCEAVGYAHSKGIIHRDLKPGNIILGKFGETVLLDWGLAKYVGEPQTERLQKAVTPTWRFTRTSVNLDLSELTMDDELVGTPAYMAPEQVDEIYGDVDTRTDVFAFGVLLFRLLTGHMPYEKTESIRALLDSIASPEPVPDPRKISTYCAPELAMICMKALSKDKDSRFENASEMAEELRAYREGRMVSIYSYTRGELFRRFLRQNKSIVIGSSLAVIAVIIGAAFSLHFAMDASLSAKTARAAIRELPNLESEALNGVMELSQQFETFFDGINKSMEQTAQTIALQDTPTSVSALPALQALNNQYPMFHTNLLISMPDGVIRAAAPAFMTSRIGVSLVDQDHVKYMATAQKPYLSRLFMTIHGYDGVVYDYPIIKNGQLTGIVNGLLLPAELFQQAFAKNNWKGQTGFHAFVVETATMRLLYNSNGDGKLGENIEDSPLTKNQPEFRNFLSQIKTKDLGIGEFVWNEQNAPVSHRPTHHICSWTTFRYGSAEWKIIVSGRFQEGVGILREQNN